MPKQKKQTPREKQIQYFKNVEEYKKDHGRKPTWGPKPIKK